LGTFHESEYRRRWRKVEREHLQKTEKEKQTGVTHSMKESDLKGEGNLWGKCRRSGGGGGVGMRAKTTKRKNMRKFSSQYSRKGRGRKGKDSSNVVLNGIKKGSEKMRE
jgi:hypothetical protein